MTIKPFHIFTIVDKMDELIVMGARKKEGNRNREFQGGASDKVEYNGNVNQILRLFIITPDMQCRNEYKTLINKINSQVCFTFNINLHSTQFGTYTISNFIIIFHFRSLTILFDGNAIRKSLSFTKI